VSDLRRRWTDIISFLEKLAKAFMCLNLTKKGKRDGLKEKKKKKKVEYSNYSLKLRAPHLSPAEVPSKIAAKIYLN
jgi:hypothetical protein